MSRSIPTFTSRRILPKFTIEGGMDQATVSKLYDSGLKELIDKEVAYEVWSDPSYSALLFPKTIPSVPYEALITLLPKDDDRKIFKTIKNIPTDTLHTLLTSARQVLEATRETAHADGHEPKSGYVFQHIGPRDYQPKAAFNTSYLPLHLHIQTYGCSIDKFELFQPSHPVSTASNEYASLESDRMHLVARDMLHTSGYSTTTRGRTALEFNQKPIAEPFNKSEAIELKSLITSWMQHWSEIASCFTDFQEDAFGRYIPFGKAKRHKNLDHYLKNTHFHFSDEAIEVLYELCESLAHDTSDPWRWTYKGVNGAAGYRFDYEKGTRSFVFSPKVYTNSYRHFDIVDQDFIITKDKNDTSVVPAAYSEALLSIQRRIIKTLKHKNS